VRLRAEHGTTIVLTTHYLDEADSLAERVVVIDHGRIIADDTPDQLKAKHVGDRVILGFDSEAGAAEAARVSGGKQDGAEVRITTEDGPRLAARLATLGPVAIEVVRPTLDDVFLTLTGRSLREDARTPELVEA
jgi:ABC-2 type transport system ATP-binding protein